MANMVEHYLSCDNLQQMLLNAGVITSETLHGTGNREVKCETVLNMKKCHEDEWKKVEKSAIEHGVVNYAYRNEDGSYGVRRDMTPEEVKEMRFWPISFSSENEIHWICRYSNDDHPAFFISKLFPDIQFKYEMFYEDVLDGGFIVKDGVFTATEEWEACLRTIEKERALRENIIDSLPF